MTFALVTEGATRLIESKPQVNLPFPERSVRWEPSALAAAGNREDPWVRNDRPDWGTGAPEVPWVSVTCVKTRWSLPMCSVQAEILGRHQKGKPC